MFFKKALINLTSIYIFIKEKDEILFGIVCFKN